MEGTLCVRFLILKPSYPFISNFFSLSHKSQLFEILPDLEGSQPLWGGYKVWIEKPISFLQGYVYIC